MKIKLAKYREFGGSTGTDEKKERAIKFQRRGVIRGGGGRGGGDDENLAINLLWPYFLRNFSLAIVMSNSSLRLSEVLLYKLYLY